MSPIVHTELSWLLAQGLAARRDRVAVTLAGVVADVDGLSIVAGLDAYAEYHHLITHGALAALATAAVCAALARSRLAVALLSALAFHLHVLCDLAGSGPGWPIYYAWPVSRAEWFWTGQWDLASVQNTIIGLVATLACLSAALWRGRTPVELVSLRADARITATLRQRLLRR